MCNATNDVDALDEVKIVWLRKISTLKEQEIKINRNRLIYNTTDSSTGKVHSVLLFDPVNHTDHGEYICRAFNHRRSYSEANVSLIIKCKLNKQLVHSAINLFIGNVFYQNKINESCKCNEYATP